MGTKPIMESITARDEIFRCAAVLLVLLLCGDLAFIAIHAANELFRAVPNPLLDLSKDKGYPEVFQYLKFFWIVILLVLTAIKHGSLSMISWILVFAYFLVDDCLRLHEDLGRGLAAHFGFQPRFGLRSKDLGEFCISSGAGVMLAVALVWAWRRGDRHFRSFSRDMLLLLGLLIFFGVGFDAAHIILDFGWWAGFLLGAMEDGGEMVAVSLILWYAFRVAAYGDIGRIRLLEEIRVRRSGY